MIKNSHQRVHALLQQKLSDMSASTERHLLELALDTTRHACFPTKMEPLSHDHMQLLKLPGHTDGMQAVMETFDPLQLEEHL